MQSRSRNGRNSPNGNGRPGPPPRPQSPPGSAAEDEESEPKNIRERLQEGRRNARATMQGVPRALSLVWDTHKGFTITMALLTVLQGIIPTLSAWISKLLIDAVVQSI